MVPAQVGEVAPPEAIQAAASSAYIATTRKFSL